MTDTAHRHADRAFLGHPRGLGFLAFTEGWEGFSFYGMQALLVLYMTGQLLKPGHIERVLGFVGFRGAIEWAYGPLSIQALASAIMGLYAALIYATPIVGGLIADRLLGRTRTVALGAALMTAGHFLMMFDASFLVALACLLAGAGCFGSLKAQVGALYAPGDLRRADAFQIYTLSVNVAVILAPVVCGTLGEKQGWDWGFGAAGVGMLIGLVTYLAGQRWLPPEPPLIRHKQRTTRAALSGHERRTVAVLFLLLPVLALAAVGNMEIFNAYLVWGQANYDLVLFGRSMPVSWLLALDAFVSTGTLVLSLLFWRWWARRRREPDEIVKAAMGALIAALAPLILAAASWHAGHGGKIGLGWGIAFHVVNDIGFANVYPVGLALFSRAAPPACAATMVSVYSLHLFLANLIDGRIGGLLDRMPSMQFWMLHAGLVGAGGLLLLLFARLFRRTLAPRNEAER